MISNTNRPIQMIFSFEGFINGADAGHEVHVSWRPESYDLSNFEPRVREHLKALADAGIGGVVINVGYDDYLENEEAWQRFLTGMRAAVEMGMRIWLYDEDGYPSGAAGGKVLRDHPELEALGLKKMTSPVAGGSVQIELPDPRARLFAVHGLGPDGSRHPVARGPLQAGAGIAADGCDAVEIYFLGPLYEGTHAVGNYSVARRYINLLDRRAVNRFLQVTHARYFERIPADLRGHVEAFFTDEPSLMAHGSPGRLTALEHDPVDDDMPMLPSVPWCDELEATFLNDHGYPLADLVPDLFSGHDARARRTRRDFRHTVSRLYEAAHGRQMATVCGALGFDCSGHYLGEDSLLQQLVLHGDLLGTLKHFHRPGLDLLTCTLANFEHQLLTHKTALSAWFLGGGKRVMSETSNFLELHGAHKHTLEVAEINCVIALQYLLGVRDFVSLFEPQRLGPGPFRQINDLAALLVETGGDRAYVPEAAVYVPLDRAWESYCPRFPYSNLGGAGMEGDVLDVNDEQLEALCRRTTQIIKQLFYANVQFVLTNCNHLGQLAAAGVTRLIHCGPGEPEPAFLERTRQAGLELLEAEGLLETGAVGSRPAAGKGVVYATYDGFIFAVNCGDQPSALTFAGAAEAVLPAEGPERKRVSGSVALAPRGCAFLFRQ